ncbi:MFS transporter [Streptomyces sp. NPDC051576]|uniref:MFS transporter n=1 Tax=Streptomyces sp. NPDC051576 TaxID=3155803 RepID=UPI0034485766
MTTKDWTVTRVVRDRNAGLSLAGITVSGFGSSALWLASGIWVKDLTGSNGLAALCRFALWAPTLVGPLLGTLADRTRRKPLMITLDLALAALLLTLFTVDSRRDLWLLFAVLFLYGAADVVHDAAGSALVSAAVDSSLLGDLNGLRMAANEGMKLVAPLAGAGLYAVYGGARVALLDAATFVLAAGLYARLRVHENAPAPRQVTNWRTQTAEGVRHIRTHPRLRPLVVAGGSTMLCAGLNGAMIYAIVAGLGHSPAFTGVLYVVQGAGSVAIGLLSGPALRRLGERRFAACGIALTAGATALRAIPSDSVALACSAAIGVGLPCVLIAALTAVQQETPDALLGRTTATANTLMFVPNALGLAVGAGLVELVDYRLVLAVLGTAELLTALPLLQSAANPSRTATRSPSDANPA